MKKLYLLIVLFFCVKISVGQLLTENFNYAAGQLITANGWTAHSGAGTNAITVSSPGLTYAGHPGSGVGNAVSMTTSGEDDNKTFTAVNSGSVYFSFLVNLSSAQSAGDYFIGFFQTTSIFPVRVYAKADGAGGFFFGLSKSNSPITYETTSRSFGTTYFVVTNYIFNTGSTTDDVLNLWVNPVIGASEPAPTIAGVTGASTDATSILAVYLRQGTASSASAQKVDALLVGTLWADVTSAGAPVPALSISSPMAAFGSVCTNTTAGPNSFTISGTNLTAANVDVAALNGYTYSTTSGGTYTSTLSLPQAGGTFSQQVFVNFTPTAVQAYNGNIAVSGGGASSSVNAAASGSGINSAPSVTTGTASAITANAATLAGNIPSTGCTALTAYGVEFSTTNGFANGSGTQVPSTNLSAGAFTADLATLNPATTYYYKAWATNSAGTTYGTQQSFTTANLSPSINTTALTSFGNVCVNTTAGPNSFTITGSNLTNEDVTVNALPGFMFSTTSGGTYTSTLTVTQPGGDFSQQVFVQFNPVALQSYNGNITITGGGIAAAVNVTATGSGVNSAPTLTTGAASAITTTGATLAGSITATGCTAVTAYGIEYSTTNGFANGTGTQVSSSNLAGGNFSAAVSGLAASTVYYYKAFATNAGGTAWGAQQTFTTASPSLSATALTAFGGVCVNATGGPLSFTLTSTNLTNAAVNIGALAGFTYATTSGGTYTPTLSITQPGGNFNQQVFVNFTPAAVQSYNGNIPVTGGGVPGTVNVAASGSGVNTPPTVVTVPATGITSSSAIVWASLPSNGCSAVTATGFEYSSIKAFSNGTGVQVPSGGIVSNTFTSQINDLVPGAKYFFRAYATNNGGTAYGATDSFVVNTIVADLRLTPVPVQRNSTLKVTMGKLSPGAYAIVIYNSSGQRMLQENLFIQATYINHTIVLPASVTRGVYRVQLLSNTEVIATKSIIVAGN